MNLFNKKMHFFLHLEELRIRIIRSIYAIILATIFLMINKNILFEKIIFGPAKTNFISYRIFNYFGNVFNIEKNLFLKEDLNIQNRNIFGQFNTYLTVNTVGGFILAFPYISYELWRFIMPGLSFYERKYSKYILILITILFLIGSLFGYFILTPFIIQFGSSFRISTLPKNIFDLYDYISIITESTLYMGLTFLFPFIIYFLLKIKIISFDILRFYRKHILLIILIIVSAITPGDLISTIIVMIPFLFLYEISIIICSLILN